jgi:hypothetical protein
MYKVITPALLCAAALLATQPAAAQTAAPDRNETWDDVTLATTVAAGGVALLMPRVFYSSPETTVGWKARWHVSVLAPVMTVTTLALLNEYEFKDSFEGDRPGCDASNRGGPGCESFGMPSTHAFGSVAAFGYGTAVFLVDTIEYSGDRFNFGSFAGHVMVPFALSAVTVAGRKAGNFEDWGQIGVGAASGLVSGALMGLMYAAMQPPECGYSGSLICW